MMVLPRRKSRLGKRRQMVGRGSVAWKASTDAFSRDAQDRPREPIGRSSPRERQFPLLSHTLEF